MTLTSLTQAYEEILQNPKKLQDEVIPTGYQMIDQILDGGFRKGNLIVIGARPGTGKTTLALNIAEKVIFTHKSVLFISLKTPLNELTDRFIASVAGIDYSRILNNTMTDEDFNKFQTGAEKLKESGEIFTDDESNISCVEKTANGLIKHHGVSLIIIDELEYLQTPGYDNADDNLNGVLIQLKKLARHLTVPVIALTQNTRKYENRSNEGPQITIPDVTMLLYQNQREPLEQQIEILIRKKYGQAGVELLNFDKHFFRLEPMENNE
jgi:replicative DNA helicase